MAPKDFTHVLPGWQSVSKEQASAAVGMKTKRPSMSIFLIDFFARIFHWWSP